MPGSNSRFGRHAARLEISAFPQSARPYPMYRHPTLSHSSGSTTYNTLGLVEGAVIVNDNGDFNAVMQQVTGKENLGTIYQAEWSYGIALRGYAWDMASGGKSPDDAALGTGANWDKTASSDKDTAGVLLVTK